MTFSLYLLIKDTFQWALRLKDNRSPGKARRATASPWTKRKALIVAKPFKRFFVSQSLRAVSLISGPGSRKEGERACLQLLFFLKAKGPGFVHRRPVYSSLSHSLLAVFGEHEMSAFKYKSFKIMRRNEEVRKSRERNELREATQMD